MLKRILQNKCPKCGEGKLFTHFAYNLRKFDHMHEKCHACGQKYSIEPSFFTGALYVSYALQVAIIVSIMLTYAILSPSVDINTKIITVVIAVILLMPITLRLSKSIWAHMFIKFEPKKTNNRC